MSDPSRILVIGAEALELATGPHNEVVVRLRGLEKEAGLVPGLAVALALSAGEARWLAGALIRAAEKAERDAPGARVGQKC